MITFSEIQFPNLSANCKHCGITTIFTGHKRYRVDDLASVLLIPEYQCQDCGNLTFSMPDKDGNNEILTKRCECGGQFRRDKPLFCHGCQINKTSLNVSD
jgi:hypothetical protein